MIGKSARSLCECVRCRDVKVTNLVEFKQNVSYFFGRRETRLLGRLCLGCLTKEFLRFELITLFGTWWGLIGCILGPYFLLHNLAEYVSGCAEIRRDAREISRSRGWGRGTAGRPTGPAIPGPSIPGYRSPDPRNAERPWA